MNRIIRVFLNVDMRNQHTGLTNVALRENISLKKLKLNEHVIFINNKKNRLKMFSSNGLLSYLKSDKGALNLNLIEQIPRCFNENETINWTKAQRLALEKQFKQLNI